MINKSPHQTRMKHLKSRAAKVVDSNLREILKIADAFKVKKFVYSIFPNHQSVFRMWWRLIFLSRFKKIAFYNMGDFSIIKKGRVQKNKIQRAFHKPLRRLFTLLSVEKL